jgi:hypothetical protein
MKIERPNTPDLSPGEAKELEHLKQVIERAIADGVITKAERDNINAIMWADKKVTPQELDLLRTMIREKVAAGDLILDYSF